MKSLRVLGSIVLGLAMLAVAFAPADVLAMVPAHDFLFGTDGVTLGATTFAALSRKGRGLENLGGIRKIILFGEEDFTDDWPKKADVVEGVVTQAMPLKAATTGVVLKMDLNTGRLKSSKKGDLGYQNIDVDLEAKFAGYDASQAAALDKMLNQGAVAICIYKDGTRVVAGTSYEPLVLEDSSDSGAKADDKLQIDLKGKGNGYSFHPPTLATAVVVAVPAAV